MQHDNDYDAILITIDDLIDDLIEEGYEPYDVYEALAELTAIVKSEAESEFN